MKWLILLSTMVTATYVSGESSYVIMAPDTIHPGMKFRGLVHMYGSYRTTRVTMSIQRDGEVVGRPRNARLSRHRPRTLDIQLPDVLERGTYTLHAQGTNGVIFETSKVIKLSNKDKSMFIQSDKAIYKPGDKVQFRTLSLLPTLKPYTDEVDISVFDSASNKIFQWKGEKGDYGVVSKEFELSPKPVFGDWKIKVEAGAQTTEKTISIAEYVLPKFQVEVLMPSYVLKRNKEIMFKVKTTYTYGKPVSGTVSLSAKVIYQHQDYESSGAKEFFSMTDTIDGEKSFSIPMSLLLEVQLYLDYYQLAVKAEVVESETGNAMTEYGYVTIYDKDAKLSFPSVNADTFKPGLSYTAYLSVTQPDGLPLAVADGEIEVIITARVQIWPETKTTASTITAGPGEEIKLVESIRVPYPFPQETSYEFKRMNLSVPADGLVVFSFDAPANATFIDMRANYGGTGVYKSLEQTYSPSDSFMQLSLAEYKTINARDSIGFILRSTFPLDTVAYQVISRGYLVLSGVINGLQRTNVPFSLTATSAMAPSARIVAYVVMEDGEMVVDSVGFDVSGAFDNQVEISLSDKEALPGEDVHVHVKAEPASHAFVLALDQSVLLLKSGNDITPRDEVEDAKDGMAVLIGIARNLVYEELEKYDSISHNDDFWPAGGNIGRLFWWPYPISFSGIDAYSILRNAGVLVLTDASIYKHEKKNLHPVFFRNDVAEVVAAAGAEGGAGLQAPGRIRTEFPETWIWSEIKTCGTGRASVAARVPDSITSWIASAFAVHKIAGFGIAPTTTKLRVFKPFFVSLNLPYSVVRGEYVVIQAIVFNYMGKDLDVKVTLSKSRSFKNIYVDCNGVEERRQEDQVVRIVVKSDESRSIYFPIVPIELGPIDIEVRAQSSYAGDGLRRQLLVVAEGAAIEFNQAVLIDLTGQSTHFKESVQIELPPNVVEGSALARISAIGDIMGSSISGLEKLLRLPTGCGEQTLLSLAPDVYITEYLQKTGQLSGAIRDKALSFMEKGYQQELTFKHNDGSFSAFGTRDNSGSMWLTAFVVKVFHQASPYILIDENVLTTAISWMISRQNENGSFPEPGRVIHKSMQGRADSGVALTIFVLISLCENEGLYGDHSTKDAQKFFEAKRKALELIELEVSQTEDLYLMGLALYAFHLAGSNNFHDLLLRLSQRASTEGGLTYWHLPEEEKPNQGTWHCPNKGNAIDVEVTSYILLTLALRMDVSSGRSILQWVTQQRNSHGGFSSTQDTVIALQAMSAFAELVHSDSTNINILVLLDEENTHTFKINTENALLNQRSETMMIPSEVEITAKGRGIALVEIAIFFNIEEEVQDTSYSLNLRIHGDDMGSFTLEVCTRRLGTEEDPGMVVAEIGILSGFEVDESKMPTLDIIKLIERLNRQVVIYFDTITSEEVCFKLHLRRLELVSNPQPAVVHIFDYYAPEFQVTGFYNNDNLKQLSICKLCPYCENCEELEKAGEAVESEVAEQAEIF